jgi:hypothetical protein
MHQRILLSLLLFSFFGCEKPCTLVGCLPYHLALSSSSSPFTAASYELTFKVDDITTTCTLETSRSDGECTGGVGFSSLSLEAGVLTLQVNGMPTEEMAHVELKRDGTLLGAKDYTPNVQVQTPNGAGCGFCTSGQDAITI